MQWAREKISQYAINTISYYARLTRARDQNEGQKGLKHQPGPENGPIKLLRLHGDCHPGNILGTPTDVPALKGPGPHFVDLGLPRY